MSYQSNPQQDEMIRQRIRAILNEKIRDRTYKGESFVGGRRKRCPKGSRRVAVKTKCKSTASILRKRARRRKRKAKLTGCYIPEQYDYSEMMGGIRQKNPNKVIAGKKSSKCNPWIQFYRRWIKDNKASLKGVSGKELAKMAAEDYRRCNRRL